MESTKTEVWPGQAYPLGATYDGIGTNFTLFSEVAERVELCLFNDSGGDEQRLDMPEAHGYVWHCSLPGIGPGRRYGYRVHGPHNPDAGLRCNPAKLLQDPYAKALDGQVRWDGAVYGYPLGGDDRDRYDGDSAPFVPRSVVTNPWFEWGDDRPLRIPWHETVLYECHVKGLTMRHPEIPPDLRGTYAGLAHPAVIEHLSRLGVTAVELMPVHQFVHDHYLIDRGLRNYWGYNSIGFLAPHSEYSAWGVEQVVSEFKYLVKTMHEAGIEIRERRRRVLITTLLVSQGVPMVRHGDELGHSQRGNNNAYCQDNELSWLDWEHADKKFLDFCAELVAFRRRHPVFRRRHFFEGRPIFDTGLSDIGWFRPDGPEMTPHDWQTGFAKSVGVFLNGDELPDPNRRGHRISDDSFLLLFNAHYEDVTFVLPDRPWGEQWLPDFDTALVPVPSEPQSAGTKVVVAARDVRIYRRV